ncbi:MAG: hypothetical protein Tsb009_13230 [Planctomycetaceae bacterium]
MTLSENSYRFETYDGFSIVCLLPELNDVPWAEIEKLGNTLIEQMEKQKASAFLIDLNALNYIGSAMVALVVRLWKSAKEQNGKIAVVNSNTMVLEVLKLSGLDKVWTIVDSREEGLKAIGASSRQIRSLTAPSGSPASSGSSGGAGLFILTLLSVIAAGAGLFLLLEPQDFAKDQRIALGLLFGGSILGLILGTATSVKCQGGKRGIGVLCILAALGIIGTGIAKTPKLRNLFEQNDENVKDRKPDDAKTGSKTTPNANSDSKTQPVKAQKPKSKTSGTGKTGTAKSRKSTSGKPERKKSPSSSGPPAPPKPSQQ